MLQISIEKNDCISMLKMLAKYNVKAICQKDSVEIEGDIPYELLKEIFKNKGILSIQNFKGEFKGEKSSYAKTAVLKSPVIKRGDIYICNFGAPTGFETGFERPVLVLQNTDSLEETKTAIVVPCSSNVNFVLKDTIIANFSNETVDNCSEFLKKYEKSSIYIHEIRAVDKSRLERYLGTAKKSLMDEIERKLKYSVGLIKASKEENIAFDEEDKNKISEISDSNDEKMELINDNIISSLTTLKDSNEDEHYEFTITKVLGKLSFNQRKFVEKFNIQELFEIINSTDYAQNKIDAILKTFDIKSKDSDMRNLILLAPSKIYSIDELIGKLPNMDKRKARTLKKNITWEIKEKTGMSIISFVEMIKKLLDKEEF